jgi:hypothetical protein
MALNERALWDYAEGKIDTIGLYDRLRRTWAA